MANIINMDGTVIIQDSSGVTVNGIKYDVPKSRLFGQTVYQRMRTCKRQVENDAQKFLRHFVRITN
jgi:hypothetical protein